MEYDVSIPSNESDAIGRDVRKLKFIDPRIKLKFSNGLWPIAKFFEEISSSFCANAVSNCLSSSMLRIDSFCADSSFAENCTYNVRRGYLQSLLLGSHLSICHGSPAYYTLYGNI
mmetsp:Transcript_2239/g.3426  ORF Transcript_2239/g.3426 Transcript_2239/m.3426 type:complete len:115 (+) Transcript_2239:1077-1421(+)